METEIPKEKKTEYVCPMHPEVRKKQRGLCPECGMQLVKGADKALGNEKHTTHGGGGNIFRRKFWVSFILSIPVIYYSEIAQTLFGYTAPSFIGSYYLSFILSSIIFFYGGWVFLSSAYRELRGYAPGMMTLISLATITAYAYSVYALVFAGGEGVLFWELATLITIMLLGHWMEMRAVSGAQSALRELSKLLPEDAEVIRGGERVVVPLEEVAAGDRVFVRPGARIPADGRVVKGESAVNEALATGESTPVEKQGGDEVIGGTINGDGALEVEVTKTGKDSFLAGVMRLVEEAQASKSHLQTLSDRAAYYLTIIAVGVAAITLFAWLFFADTSFAVKRMVAVLVITCPHALGLAIPLVASISTTKAAGSGFLVRRRLALESARNVDVVLFDKTGTLTTGEFGVLNMWAFGGKDEPYVLRQAASVDASSEHAVARAIVEYAKDGGVSPRSIEGFERLPGRGVRARIGEAQVAVGGSAMLDMFNGEVPSLQADELASAKEKGQTVVYVFEDSTLIGAIALADVIREESYEAVAALRGVGIKVAILTGDSEDVAGWVAGELGIGEYFANVLPEEKQEKVKLLQSRGQKVAMVGDGINDAPALVEADIGIAIGAGTNVAIESAGIILVKNDPRDIAKVVRLSRLTYTKMVQNLFWATGYNVVAIPLAAGAAAAWGIFLQPAVAAILMSLSTVIVAVNAMLLKGKEL